MNPGARTGGGGDARRELVEDYEALRRQVLQREANRGWGLALLVHRGMAAWASSWTQDTAPPAPAHPTGENPRHGLRQCLPQATHDLVGVLCAMVWACQREAAA